jgi:hypothetical protein
MTNTQNIIQGHPVAFKSCAIWTGMLNSKNLYIEAQSGESVSDSEMNKKTDTKRGDDYQTNFGSTARAADDAIVDVATLHNAIDIPRTLINFPNDGVPASVKSFLAKPYNYIQGDLTITDTATTFPQFATSLPLRTNKMFVDKLSGVMSMRYTTVVTLQVNANRFQQGRYILAFVPTGGASFDPSSDSHLLNWVDMHRANRCQITQLHHVELDVGTDTSVQLRIPYQSAFPALCWNPTANLNFYGDPGQIFLYPYSPLSAVTGNTTAGFTIWIHYEDVEVFGNTKPLAGPRVAPAPPPVEAQSGFAPRNRRGVTSKKNVSIFSTEQSLDKPLSEGLKLISEGSEQLSKVPLLSSLAGPISWVTNVMSDTAKSFGWSKPTVKDKIIRINRYPHPYIANEDQPDDSQPLSLFSDNHIDVTPGFAAVDTDELSINYLKSIFAFTDNIPWATSQAQGTVLVSGNLEPSSLACSNADIPAGAIQHTPVSLMSTLFSRYSGGIMIKIKIVKTEFHSGRLLFAFNPYESACFEGYITYADTPYLHKTILDVREQNEFTIEVPYVSISPWRNCGTQFDKQGCPYGSFSIFVLDELVAPETVPNAVQILIEVAGAPDLKFSVPRRSVLTPMLPATLQMGTLFDGDSDNNPTLNDVSTIGNAKTMNAGFSQEEHCVGEAVVSLRSLLKRGSYMGYTLNSATTTQNVTVLPWAWTYTSAVTPTEKEVITDIFGLLSSMYCLQRGGVRLRNMITAGAGNLIASMNTYKIDTANSTKIFNITNKNTQTYTDGASNSQLSWGLQELGGMSVNVPFYHYTHSSPTASQAIGTGATYSFNPLTGANTNVVEFQYQPSINLRTNPFYRAGSDDCNFGGFTSIPLLVPAPIGAT